MIYQSGHFHSQKLFIKCEPHPSEPHNKFESDLIFFLKNLKINWNNKNIFFIIHTTKILRYNGYNNKNYQTPHCLPHCSVFCAKLGAF